MTNLIKLTNIENLFKDSFTFENLTVGTRLNHTDFQWCRTSRDNEIGFSIKFVSAHLNSPFFTHIITPPLFFQNKDKILSAGKKD